MYLIVYCVCTIRNMMGSIQDVSDYLKKPWTTLKEPQLHPVIWNSNAGDSDEFVLPYVLQDIEP